MNSTNFNFILFCKNIYCLIFIFLTLLGCKDEGAKENNISSNFIPVIKAEPSKRIIQIDSPVNLNYYYDDISKFIAGMQTNSSSRFKDKSNSKQFNDYSKTIDLSFSKFRKNKLDSLINWRDSTLSSLVDSNQNVLYPFSGPDFVYAHSIFPNARNYFLFGLEPVGIIPNIENCPADSLVYLFKSINATISDNLNLSFFITKKMKKQFSSPEIKGTIPILLFFMSRLNLHIQDIQPVNLDAEGNISNQSKNQDNKTKKTFKYGVDISFVRPNDNKLCHVYYFSLNINNKGLNELPQLPLFLNSFVNSTNILIKSASYCLHEEKYSGIREILMKKAEVIVQDDTGIPFRFLNQNEWLVNLYGSYSKPISVFSEFLQKDYKDAFRKNAQPLNFRFGYLYPSNILVAKKK
jgi:hypothetical protein